MKIISLVLLFLFTLNCSINKVSNTHGFRFLESKFEKVIINKSNKNDIEQNMKSGAAIAFAMYLGDKYIL